MAELLVWHESTRISHAEAAEKAKAPKALEPHPSIGAFYAELIAQVPEAKERKSHVVVRASGKGTVARVRYLAAKHRLVVFDPAQRAVVNPPLLRRPDSYELATEAEPSIEDPTPEHIVRAAHNLSDANWFMSLEGMDDHFVQCGYGARAGVPAGRYMLETREDKHLQVEVAGVGEVVAAFQAQLSGDLTWRDRFSWKPVVNQS
jgi:hypothetical protein